MEETTPEVESATPETPTSPQPATQRRSSRLPAVVALVAGLGGVAALVVAAVLFFTQDDPPLDSTTTTAVVAASTVRVADATGRLSIEVPDHWTDVGGDGWFRDGDEIGVAVNAAVDREAWRVGWSTPGVFVGVSDTLTETEQLFGDFGGSCDFAGREPLSGTEVVGEVERWEACGEVDSDFAVAAVVHSSGAVVLIQLVLVDAADGSIDTILNTLRYQS